MNEVVMRVGRRTTEDCRCDLLEMCWRVKKLTTGFLCRHCTTKRRRDKMKIERESSMGEDMDDYRSEIGRYAGGMWEK